MKHLSFIALLSFFIVEAHSQNDMEKRNSIWGKLSLEQISPNQIHYGETITINYRAIDAHYVAIALCDKKGKVIQLYDDLYPGIGQIRIREGLSQGKYCYVLLVNGRLIKKRKFEVIGTVAKRE